MSTHKEFIDFTSIEAVDLKSLQFLFRTQLFPHLKTLCQEFEAHNMFETLEPLLAVYDIANGLFNEVFDFLHLVHFVCKIGNALLFEVLLDACLLYTSPSPRD